MNDENNVFDSNDQAQDPGYHQPPYENQGQDGSGSVNLQKNIPPQGGESVQRPQYGVQTQEQGYHQQPYGNQPGYQQPYGGQNQYTSTSGYAEPVYQQESQSTVSAESGGFGIASMICGIIALLTCCLWCTCIPLAIVSIVLGVLQISKGTAKGMAIAGIICSAIALIMLLVLTIVGVIFQNSPAYYDLMRELQYMNYRHHM